MSVGRVIAITKDLCTSDSDYLPNNWDTSLDGKPHKNSDQWHYSFHPLSFSPNDHPFEDGNHVNASFGLTISRRIGKFPDDQVFSAIYGPTEALEQRAVSLIDLIQSNKYVIRETYMTGKPSWCYDLLDGPDWGNSLQFTLANTLWYNPTATEVRSVVGCYVPIVFKLRFGKVY